MNPFQNQKIIQNLAEQCSNYKDKETTMKLRQVSTNYYKSLNKQYKQYKQYIHAQILFCSFPSGFQRKLNPENWSPTIAKTIRVLEFGVEGSSEYCDISPSETQNWTFYHRLLNQIFSYITTLKLLELPEGLDPTKLSKFIQQFVSLKNISLGNCHTFPAKKFAFIDIKSVLSTLKASGVIVELILDCYYINGLERILAPEKGIKSAINRVAIFQPYITRESTLQRFANLIQENQSIISDIQFYIIANDVDDQFQIQVGNDENILKQLRVISPFVSVFQCYELDTKCDFFNTVYWPNLVNLRLLDYKMQLPNLSISCPKLRELTIGWFKEDDVFFSNNGATVEQDLKHIFGGCSKTLKKLWYKCSTVTSDFKSPKLRLIRRGCSYMATLSGSNSPFVYTISENIAYMNSPFGYPLNTGGGDSV